jgi:hypothetical protein
LNVFDFKSIKLINILNEKIGKKFLLSFGISNRAGNRELG